LVRDVASKLKEALGPTQRERGGVRPVGTDEVAENRGRCGDDGLPEVDTVLLRMRRRGGLLL
jgi:hypothetical protein